MNLEEELKAETLKWLRKAEERVKKLRAEERGKKFMENINAYIKDARWFLERGDLIRAFECVVWAWAWMEIGEEVGFLKSFTETSESSPANQESPSHP